MTALPVSVVVVSHGRPQDLAVCLQSLEQLDYPAFEVVVVADGAALRSVPDYAKVQTFEEANVARARNIGVALAAGEIVAFIDDDAVAEPGWLAHLCAPFADTSVVASGGYVIGRNGISYQWTGLSVDNEGWDHPLDVVGDAPAIFTTERDGRGIRTQGTNMAFRRSALVALGGFDPVFAFFHDDSDMNLRVASSGGMTAVVPQAVVHHKSAPSALRRADRAPLGLAPIGASRAAFHRKHLAPRDWARGREELWEAQHRRLCGFLIDGRCEPIEVERLLRDLLQGYDEGLIAEVGQTVDYPRDPPAFRPVPRPFRGHNVLAGTWRERARLTQEASALVAQRQRVSLILLERTSRFHHIRFHDGVWQQTGGQFGRSLRSDPVFRRWRFDDRVARETTLHTRLGADSASSWSM